MRSSWARQRKADGPDLVAAEARLDKPRRGMGRLIGSYAEGLIERAEFEPRIAGLRQRLGEWEAQLKAVRDEAAQHTALTLVIGRLEDLARRTHDRVADADWDTRRELICLLVKRVEISCTACRTWDTQAIPASPDLGRDWSCRVHSPKPCDMPTEGVG